MEGQEGLPEMPAPAERISISSREAGIKLGQAQDVIGKHLDQGFFGKEGEERYENAKKASSYKGTGVDSTQEESDQIFAMRDSVKELVDQDTQARGMDSFFSGNLVVDVQEGDKTVRYSISEFEEKLETIKNDSSLSEEQKKEKSEQLKQEARCGFLTEKEQAQSTQENQEKSPEDILISGHRKLFEKKFKEAEERGDTPKEQLEQLEKIGETLVMLRLAEEANGEAGIILKHLALKNLEENYGAQGLGDSIENLGKQAAESINKVCERMEPGKAEEFRNAIKEGKLEDLITSGKLPKIEGMRELLFGKDFTEEKLKEILDLNKKKKWGNALLLALLILLIGPIEMSKQVVPMSGGN